MDITANYIETPGGLGKFVEYDDVKHTVTMELDYKYLVEYPIEKCIFIGGNKNGRNY
jgi:hypothetical protein